MFSFSRPKLAALLLIAGLAAGWGWDHVRTTRLLRRTTESEQYFRQRLFERWGDKGDEGDDAKRPQVPQPDRQN